MRKINLNIFVQICLLISLLIGHPVYGSNVEVKSYVDKTVVGLNQQFTLHVEISGENINSVPNPQLPKMDDFSVFLGSGSSQNYQFINGKASVSKIISYHFQATKIGVFKIGAVSIRAGQRTLKTDQIDIKIEKAAASTSQQPSGNRQQKQKQSSGISDDDLFMKAIANKKQVYQNEPVIVTYKIYTLVNISNIGMSKVPGTTGFWVEEYSLKQQLPTSHEVINGKRYTVATLKKMALFPMSAGQKTLDPMAVDCDVRVRTRSRDVFDSFFNDPFFSGRSIRKSIQSNPLQINVLSLPEEGRPSDFTGMVGQFSIKSFVDKRQIKTNEAVSFKVTLSGTGNIRTLPEPKVRFPADFELYPPKTNEKINRQDFGISGTKTYEYVLVPRLQGKKTIQAIALNYFDPKAKSYKTAKTAPILLDVTKGDETFTVFHGEGGKTQVQWFGQDIRFIKSQSASFYKMRQPVFKNGMFWIILFLPWIATASALFYRKHLDRLHGDVAYARDRRASRAAKKRLCAAKTHLQSSKQNEFYAEIAKTLTGYLGDKLNIDEAGLMTDDAKKQLQKRGVGDETIDLYFDLLNTCDMKRFSPTNPNEEEMRAFYKKSEQAFIKIEKEIP